MAKFRLRNSTGNIVGLMSDFLTLGWRGPGAVVNNKAACLESRRSRVRPRSGIQVSKKQNVSTPLTRKGWILLEPP